MSLKVDIVQKKTCLICFLVTYGCIKCACVLVQIVKTKLFWYTGKYVLYNQLGKFDIWTI